MFECIWTHQGIMSCQLSGCPEPVGLTRGTAHHSEECQDERACEWGPGLGGQTWKCPPAPPKTEGGALGHGRCQQEGARPRVPAPRPRPSLWKGQP